MCCSTWRPMAVLAHVDPLLTPSATTSAATTRARGSRRLQQRYRGRSRCHCRSSGGGVPDSLCCDRRGSSRCTSGLWAVCTAQTNAGCTVQTCASATVVATSDVDAEWKPTACGLWFAPVPQLTRRWPVAAVLYTKHETVAAPLTCMTPLAPKHSLFMHHAQQAPGLWPVACGPWPVAPTTPGPNAFLIQW